MNPNDLETSKTLEEPTQTRAPYTPPKLEDNGFFVGVVGTTLQINSIELFGDEGE
jgi:hypothetical protein